MPATLTLRAMERSTYIITASFKDASDVPVEPDSIVWTLTDENGRVMNGRNAETILVPAVSIDILLSSGDLALTDARDNGCRVVTVAAVYDSTEGTDLPLKDEVRFRIAPLVKVT